MKLMNIHRDLEDGGYITFMFDGIDSDPSIVEKVVRNFADLEEGWRFVAYRIVSPHTIKADMERETTLTVMKESCSRS